MATVFEGDLVATLSIATPPRCRGGCYSILWIAPLYPWSVPYNFLSLWYDSTWDWTPVSRTIGEHSNHYANGLFINFRISLIGKSYSPRTMQTIAIWPHRLMIYAQIMKWQCGPHRPGVNWQGSGPEGIKWYWLLNPFYIHMDNLNQTL